jgi:hypothetical protein
MSETFAQVDHVASSQDFSLQTLSLSRASRSSDSTIESNYEVVMTLPLSRTSRS